ncbi:MAG: gamma-glutamyl-gamma-aminobutyrate hydrolase family protein [Rhodobacteraceae bacterium]|nr:gamma-glutamyl-gamma-aminobutyrate hydrolase family protein [Paracoccaceae bacterium]
MDPSGTRRPLIGIIGNYYLINDEYPAYAAGQMNVEAVHEVSCCQPSIVPTDPAYVSANELADTYDGFIFTGGRANVHPSEYGEPETEAHGTFDLGRDGVTLPLIRALVERGQPMLAICRGFQEFNVAMGGSLYPEIRDLPGRDNHRMPPDGTLEEKFALRHDVTLTKGGPFARLIGSDVVRTNTLHGQGIKALAPSLVIDGTAPDGTPEAIYVAGGAGFALGVQWHPEYRAAEDPVSRPLFEAFGEAARAWAAGARPQENRAAS